MESCESVQLDSPFARHFGANFIPSLQEISDIRRLLLESEKSLQALENEISRLQAQREKIKSFIDGHRALLSPIRRVHVDVLRAIFVECLPKGQLPTRSLQEAPLLLTGICKSWREVAISMPHLWNRIHISLPYPRYPPVADSFRSMMKIRATGVQLWLERSGSIPLTLSLHAIMPSELIGVANASMWYRDHENWRELQTLYTDFTRQLLPFAPRWKSLSLNIPAGVRKVLEDLEERCLDMLEEFTSIYQRCYESGIDEGDEAILVRPLHVLLGRSPSIRVLRLQEAYLDLPIRWGNLTTISVGAFGGEFIGPSKTLNVLSASSTLQYCSLYIKLAANDAFHLSSPVVLPYLSTLDIEFTSSRQLSPSLATAQMQEMFDVIIAPALTDLSVIVTWRHFGLDIDLSSHHLDTFPFHSFVERSGCALSHFTLDLPFPDAPTALVKILQLMPSLIDLKLDSSGSGQLSSFFAALTPSPSSPDVPCPHLETLTYSGCTHTQAESLLAFAAARVSGTQRLKRMVVIFNDRSFQHTVSLPTKLQLLREQGMFIQWLIPREQEQRAEISDEPRADRNVFQRYLSRDWEHVPPWMCSY